MFKIFRRETKEEAEDKKERQETLHHARQTLSKVKALRSYYREYECVDHMRRDNYEEANPGSPIEWSRIAPGWLCMHGVEVPGFCLQNFNFFICYAERKKELKLHSHTQSEMVLVMGGSMDCVIQRPGENPESRSIDAEVGNPFVSLMVIEPNVYHAFTPKTNCVLLVTFRPPLLSE